MTVSVVKVGEKGQITIPTQLRDQEQIEKGSLLEVVDLGDGNILLTKMNKKQEFKAAMKILGKRLLEKGYTSDEKIISFCRQMRKEVYDESSRRH